MFDKYSLYAKKRKIKVSPPSCTNMKFFCCTKQELVRGEKKWIAYEYKNISKSFTFHNNCAPAIRVS